jgi:uncharacterized protein YdhG (YjbR/CyaY superfamily)
MTPQKKIASVDEYIQSFPKDVQVSLGKVRRTLHKIVPGAVETISYGIPCLMFNSRYLVYFAGWKKHVSLYPIPAGTPAYRKKIAKYVGGKGTLKFPLTDSIPLDIVEDTVKLLLKDKKGSI